MFVRESLQSLICFALLSAVSIISASAAEANAESSSLRSRQSRFSEQTSEENREGKRFLISAQPFGNAVGSVNSLGLNAGYYLTPDTVLQIEASRGRTDQIFYTLSAATAGINIKQFLGNSFYIKGGGVYRQLKVSDVWCILCERDTTGVSADANSIAVEITIGNQWQWSNFTLGADWIGAMIPVTTTERSFNSSAKQGLSESQQRSIDESWERVAKTTSFQLLRFYVGASF